MRKRLSWWKKYADIPSEFSLADQECRKQFLQDGDKALSDTMAIQVRYNALYYTGCIKKSLQLEIIP